MFIAAPIQTDLDGCDFIARFLRDFHLSAVSDLVLNSKRLTRIPLDLAGVTDITSLDLSGELILSYSFFSSVYQILTSTVSRSLSETDNLIAEVHFML